MPYLFTCPHCQTQTMVDDQYSGLSGECVTCGRPVQIPAFTPTGKPIVQKSSAGVRVAAGVLAAAAIFFAIAFVAVRYGGQGIQTVMSNRSRGQCIQNLEKIAKALNAYANDYGTYPPATTFAADGKAMHSWRVLILPYLGYQDLYNKYDRNQPWDAQANMPIVFEMPNEYRSPASATVTGTEPNYFLITGPNTLFPKSGPLGPANVIDSTAKTILLVESDSGALTTAQWTEPGDFDIQSLSMSIGTEIGGSHEGGTTLVTVDGRGHFISDQVEPSVIMALITPAGGEGLSDDVLD